MSRISSHRSLAFIAAAALVVVAACHDTTTQPLISAAGAPSLSRSTVTDPTATWSIPLADQGLNLRSDGEYPDAAGVNSVYANGVCGISTTIFATTAASNSGDATINSGTSRNCSRQFFVMYPDGTGESFRSFNNLRDLQNTTDSIAVGDSALHMFVVNPGTLSNNPSRCGTIYFGPGPLGDKGVGSNPVWVRRIDGRTWHVHSQASDATGQPQDWALCANNGLLYQMQVDLTIMASRDLP